MRPALSDSHGPVAAILASDLHLCHTAPLARSNEPDWYDAMYRTMCELYNLLSACGNTTPVVYAGDIFDRWFCPPELINWAIRALPRGYSIPGQHDLPNHNLDEIKRSAYWTLVEAGVLHHLEDGIPYQVNRRLWVEGFPWGVPVTSRHMDLAVAPTPKPTIEDCFTGRKYEHILKLAVVHAYIWTDTTGYKDAPVDAKLDAWADRLAGFTNAVFGDNHIGFLGIAGNCRVLNNGSTMCRKSDQIRYEPGFGVLYGDGYIQRWPISTDADTIENMVEQKGHANSVNAEAFIAGLLELGNGLLDYREAVETYLRTHACSPQAERILRGFLDGCERK